MNILTKDTAVQRAKKFFSRKTNRANAEIVVWFLTLSAASVLTCCPSGTLHPLLAQPYWLFPIMMWAVLRFSPHICAVGLGLVGFILVASAAAAVPPPRALANDSRLSTVLFFGVGSVTTVFASAIVYRSRQALDERSATENLYQRLLDWVSDVIWVYDLRTMRYVFISPSVETLRGYRVEEVIAHSLEESVTPASLVQIQGLIAEMASQGNHSPRNAYTCQLEQTCKDGTTVWAEVSMTCGINPKNHHLEVYGVSRNITQRRLADLALIEQKDLLEIVFENSPNIMMLINDAGRVISINRSGELFAGLPREELTNLLGGEVFQCVNALFGLGCGRNHACAHCPVRTRVNTTFTTGNKIFNEKGQLTIVRDGKSVIIHFLISVEPVTINMQRAVLVTITDINELIHIQNDLFTSKEKYRQLFEHMTSGFVLMEPIADDQGKAVEYVCIEANTAIEELIGHQPDDLIGKTTQRISNEYNLSTLFDFPRQTTGMPANESTELSLPSLNKHVERLVYMTDNKVAIILNDITARKQAEEEIYKAHQQLQNRIIEIERLQAELREQAIQDPLTGLHNRRYMVEAFQREISRASRAKHSITVFMIDIDHFKEINDFYSHQAGDLVMEAIGKQLKKVCRAEDIICRYGGDEFIVIMQKLSLPTSLQRAKQIRTAVEQTRVTYKGEDLHVTVSIGLAIYPDHGTTQDKIFQAADIALYRGKHLGRNRAILFEPGMLAEHSSKHQ